MCSGRSQDSSITSLWHLTADLGLRSANRAMETKARNCHSKKGNSGYCDQFMAAKESFYLREAKCQISAQEKQPALFDVSKNGWMRMRLSGNPSGTLTLSLSITLVLITT